ncbi:hypothetical protein ACHAWX_005077 [Stephanocyclus meneghinianus]
MSRHRNIRNLEEDDYYDDYDYDDEDDYYLEQQREKERKAKIEAERKAKVNQAKQLQQKPKQVKTPQQQSTNQQKKASTTKLGMVTGGNKGISIAVPTDSTKKTSLGQSLNNPSYAQTKAINNSNNNNSNSNSPPELPAHVLAKLRSLSATPSDSTAQTLRSHLSLVILGHVDAGKSTLTGRLLLSLNHVSSRLLQKYQRESATIGKTSFALAWFTDEDDAERERGVTVDVGTKFIRTEKFDFTVLDAPGHRDFVPNMISGAAGADCGLLVVAATTGEFEAGFAAANCGEAGAASVGGQTREHVILSRGLGVSQLIVAVNKLDAAEPPWEEGRFEHIKSQVLAFLLENGFKEKRIQFVPVSGLTGVNVSNEKRKETEEEGWKLLRKWYKGPTLIEALNAFVPAKREFEKPLRLIVTDVSSEGKMVTVRGRIVQGFLRAGDGVTVLPVGDDACAIRVERGKATKESDSPYSSVGSRGNGQSTSAEMDLNDIAELRNCALAGDTVECGLSGIDAARVSPGCVICHPQQLVRPRIERKFEARVMVMEYLAVPIIRGSQVLFHMHSIDVPAVLNRLMTSKKRGEANARSNPRVLTGGVEATVEITLSERLVLEEYSECKSLGRFVLRRGGDTIAIGLIEKVLDT